MTATTSPSLEQAFDVVCAALAHSFGTLQSDSRETANARASSFHLDSFTHAQQAMLAVQQALKGCAHPSAEPAQVASAPAAVLSALDVAVAWLESARNTLLVAATGTQAQQLAASQPGEVRTVSDIRSLELAAVLGLTPNAMRNQVHQARTALSTMQPVQQLLERGQLNAMQARLMIQGANNLESYFKPDQDSECALALARYSRLVIRFAQIRAYGQLRKKVNDLVNRLRPYLPPAEREHLLARREVSIAPAGDGLSWLTALLPTESADRVWAVLEHAARTDTSLNGSTANRMADALVNILDGSAELPAHLRSAAAEIQVICTPAELAELQAAAAILDLNPQAEIDLHLPELAGLTNWLRDAKFRRWICEPVDGQLLHLGRTTYRPSRQLSDFVRTRDEHCRAPGCTRQARYCDLDHIQPWESGGETSADNLATLCRTHHLLKTHAGWSYRLRPDGSISWTLPGNQRAESPPPRRLQLAPAAERKREPDPPPF